MAKDKKETQVTAESDTTKAVATTDFVFEAPWDNDVEQTVPDQLPFLKTAYDNTNGRPEDCKNGDLFNSVTGEVYADGFTGILLNARLAQIEFPVSFSPENKEVCKSNDGIVPTGDGTDPMPGPCRARGDDGKLKDSCPHLQWTETESGKRIPPLCAMKYQLLFWDTEGSMPIMASCKSAEIASFRSLKGELKREANGAVTRNGAPALAANLLMPISVTTAVKQAAKGKHFPKVFKVLHETVNTKALIDLQGFFRDLIAQSKAIDVAADYEVEVPTESKKEAPDEVADLPF